jgi:L-iditol 2-dehydrogenase
VGEQKTNRVAACIGGLRTRIEERPAPEPGAGEMLLRLRVAGLCGTDLFKLETGTVSPGQVLGHEIVGQVESVGEGVGEFRRGDRVVVPHHVPCGDCVYCRRGSPTMCRTFKENLLEPGGFADLVLVRPRAAALAARKLPDSLTDEAAVFMEPAACVLRGVGRSDLGHEGVAVVQGAGSMGLLHVAVLAGLFPEVAVVAVDPVADRRALAEKIGARRGTAPGEETSAAVRDLSGGHGADAVFDTVGGPGPLDSALALTREGGTVVLFAHAPAGARAGFDLNHLFKHERRVLGTYSAGLAEQADVFRALESGRLDPRPLVSHRMPLEDLDRAVEILRGRGALKILLYPGGTVPSAKHSEGSGVPRPIERRPAMMIPGTMRGAMLLGPETIETRKVPVPEPGPGEALIRIGAATTCGTDVKVFRRGGHPRMLKVPTLFGHEFAGTVAAIGKGVTGFAPGDRLVVANSAPCGACMFCLAGRENLCEDLHYLNGAFAEFILAPARFVAKNAHLLPPSLPFERAALTEPLACVLHGMEASGLWKAGDGPGSPPAGSHGLEVAIYGAGPIGLLFVAAGARCGHRVILADLDAGRLETGRLLGAVVTVELGQGGGGAEAVRARTEGRRGAEVAIDATGAPEAWKDAIASVRPGGIVNLFGGVAPGIVVPVDATHLHYQEITLKGVYHHRPATVRAALAMLADPSFPAGPLLSSECSIEQVAEALRSMMRKEALKVVVRP